MLTPTHAPRPKHVIVYVTEDEHRKIKGLAKANGCTVSALLRTALSSDGARL